MYKSSTFFVLLFLLSSNSILGQVVFGEEIVIAENLNGFLLKSIVVDIDKDNDKDLILLFETGLTIYRQLSPTTFEENDLTFDIFDQITAIASDDINNDGFIDLIIGTRSGKLFLTTNDKSGNFIENQNLNITQNNGITDIIVFDLDGDNDKEIVCSLVEEDKIYWYEKLANNMYSDFKSIPYAPSSNFSDGPSTLNAIDIDNDLDLDLIVYNTWGIYSIYENLGGQNFATGRELLDNIFNSSNFADYDGDGTIDIYDGDNYTIFLNDGLANFDSSISLLGVQVYGLTMGTNDSADFDNDGDIDIIRGFYSLSEKLQFFTNNGDNNFAETIFENDPRLITRTIANDLDNNGTQDVILLRGPNFINSEFPATLIWHPNLLSNESISGCNYYDENRNGLKDKNEKPINNILSKLETSNRLFSTDENGCFSYSIENGSYKVTFEPNQNWILSSDSSSYSINIDDNSIANLDFGFVPRDTFIAGIMHAVSGITRCNTDVKFNFIFQNQGTSIISEGTMWVYQDSLTELATQFNPIDTMLSDKIWGWNFKDLYPGETITRTVELSVPGLGGDIEPGTLIEIFSATEAMNSLGWVNFFKHNYAEEIRCAYDPNDKLISPMREEEENYTLFGDTLVYTVRFQNTGNDTAFNVVIRDTLDQNLEVGTFNIIHSSHREVLRTEILDGQFITFSFEDILLPDSTIDFIGSQGYVTYAIEAKDPIPENTEILNTASIYFDFNPPIVTNTTLNTLVSCYPIEEQFISVSINEGEVYNLPDGTAVSQTGTYEVAIEDEEGCPIEYYIISLEVLTSTNDLKLQSAISIAPNPVHDDFILTLDIDGEIDLLGTISDPFDKKITTASIISGNTKFDTHQLTSGVYFLQIHTKGGELIAVKKFVVNN